MLKAFDGSFYGVSERQRQRQRQMRHRTRNTVLDANSCEIVYVFNFNSVFVLLFSSVDTDGVLLRGLSQIIFCRWERDWTDKTPDTIVAIQDTNIRHQTPGSPF